MEKTKTREQVLAESGMYVSTPTGSSMRPFLCGQRDTVIISPVQGRLKKYDVPLYKKGDKYVLHRVIKVLPDSYVIRGDNCEISEHGITDEDIVGVMTAFFRKDRYGTTKDLKYRLYVFVWCHIFWLRRPLKKIYRLLKRKK